jgi:hypothetical protein
LNYELFDRLLGNFRDFALVLEIADWLAERVPGVSKHPRDLLNKASVAGALITKNTQRRAF